MQKNEYAEEVVLEEKKVNWAEEISKLLNNKIIQFIIMLIQLLFRKK